MQIGEEHVRIIEHRDLLWLRLFDFDDQLTGSENFFGIRKQPCTSALVVFVEQTNGIAGITLHVYLMAMMHGFSNAGGRHPHPVFVCFDFCRNPYFHHAPRALMLPATVSSR